VELTNETVVYFLLFLVPGFVAHRVFSAFVVTRSASDEKGSVLSLAGFGACLFPVTLPLAMWADGVLNAAGMRRELAWALSAGVWPASAGAGLGLLVRSKSFLSIVQRLRLQSPIATAWDHFFSQSKRCLVRVTLNDGNVTGGVWTGSSFASSGPGERDLYVSQQWEFDPTTAVFVRPVENSLGIWIAMSAARTVEFFEITPEEPSGAWRADHEGRQARLES
jgi:hypothetical protein